MWFSFLWKESKCGKEVCQLLQWYELTFQTAFNCFCKEKNLPYKCCLVLVSGKQLALFLKPTEAWIAGRQKLNFLQFSEPFLGLYSAWYIIMAQMLDAKKNILSVFKLPFYVHSQDTRYQKNYIKCFRCRNGIFAISNVNSHLKH